MSELEGIRICNFTNRFTKNNRDQLLQQTVQPEPPKNLPRGPSCPGSHNIQSWLSRLPGSRVGKMHPKDHGPMSANSEDVRAFMWEHNGETHSIDCTTVKNKPRAIAGRQHLSTRRARLGV